MSAFQAYGGAYEVEGEPIRWRCYATAPVYEVRTEAHLPLPPAPAGQKWLLRRRNRDGATFGWRVDAITEDFSDILLQVERAEPQRVPRKAGAKRTIAA